MQRSETPTPPRYGREGEIEARGSSSGRVSPRARTFGRYASRTSTRSSIDPGKGSANTNANLDPFRRTNSVPLHGPARLISTADPSNREVSDDAAQLSASTCTGAPQYTNTPQLLVPTPPKNNHPKTAPFSRARSAGVTNNASGAGRTIVARLSGDPGSDSDDIQVVQRALRRPTTAVSVSPGSRPRSSSPDALRRVCREMRAEGEAKFMSTRHPGSHSSSNTDEKMQERGRRPSIITPLSGFKDWQNAQAQKARASPDRGPIQNRSTISQGRVVGNAEEAEEVP